MVCVQSTFPLFALLCLGLSGFQKHPECGRSVNPLALSMIVDISVQKINSFAFLVSGFYFFKNSPAVTFE